MRRRQFQEVALSLSAPGTFLPASTPTSTPGPAPTLVRVRALHPRTPSPAKSPTVSETDTADPESYPITPPSPPSRARSGASIMKKEGSLLGRLVSATASLRGGTEKAQDPPTPQRTPPAPRREAQTSSVQEGGLEQRVDAWITGLKAATALDGREAYQEALLAYTRSVITSQDLPNTLSLFNTSGTSWFLFSYWHAALIVYSKPSYFPLLHGAHIEHHVYLMIYHQSHHT